MIKQNCVFLRKWVIFILELENLDDESFSELMKKCVSEIPGLCPEWTDFNEHDPGITFLEMLMWLTEMQRYYLSQITEGHLESYLKLLGTSARPDEPSVILCEFFPEDPVLRLRKGTALMIGEIPFRLAHGTVLTRVRPEIFSDRNDPRSVYIKLDPAPFQNGILPLYFSLNENLRGNPMKKGFYPQAEIRVSVKNGNLWMRCLSKDTTYGFYQSGFVSVRLPEGISENPSVLRLSLVSGDPVELPKIEFFSSNMQILIQCGENGQTLGAEGRIKENLSFLAEMDGRKIKAVVYKEIKAGRNAETPREAFKRYQSERRHIPRAVSAEDYRRIALGTPGLRAELIHVFSRKAGEVSVCVKPRGKELRESEIKNLRKTLFEAKPIGTEIRIIPPVVFSAKLFISAGADGWAGERKLSEHIREVFAPLEKRMGAEISMPEIVGRIGAFPIVTEVKSVLLRFGRGIELTERDTLKLPEDGLFSLEEIIIQ